MSPPPDPDSTLIGVAGPFILTTHKEDRVGITFTFEGRRVTVTVFTAPVSHRTSASEPLENFIVRRIHLVSKAHTTEDYIYLLIRPLRMILNAGMQEISQAEYGLQSLEALLYPMLFFTLQTTSGGATVVQVSQEDVIRAACPPSPLDPLWLELGVGYYPARHFFLNKMVRFKDRAMGRVNLAGHEVFCKAYTYGLADKRYQRDLAVLMDVKRIKDRLPNNIRVPPLTGYITNELGALIGMMQPFITTASCYGGRLADVIMAQVPREIRVRWRMQIRDTVEILYVFGLAWRDCRSSSILIDELENLWLSPLQLDSEPG